MGRIKDGIVEFPDCWEEISPKEWEYLLKLHFRLCTHIGLSVADVKREWCRFVLANRGIRSANKEDYYLLIHELSIGLDWMYIESEDGKEILLNFDSTMNLIPVWRNLKGPLSHGSDLTFGEFRKGVQLMNLYNESKDILDLRALCGLLYRREGKKVGKNDFDGRYREDFHPSRIGFYSDRVRMMPAHLQWGVYVWFANFCRFLITGTFIIEGCEVCFSSLFAANKKGDDTSGSGGLGMNSILFSVAETGVFGNVEETDNTLLLKVLLKLMNDKLLADEMLKKK